MLIMESQYYKLSENDIDFIKAEVKKSEISFSHLEEEIIDHICCMVEEFINQGYSFDAAFKAVRKDLGMDSLKAIEIQTLILINKKFNAMKKTLKISGIIGLSAIAMGSFMKIMHWQGASIVILFGFTSLLLAYLPALWLTLRKEKILKRKMQMSYIGILAAFALLMSVLFTNQNWPYSDYLRLISWILMLIFLVMIYKHVMQSEENRVLNMSILLLFSTLFVISISFNFFDLKNPRLSKYTLESNIEASIQLYDNKAETLYHQLNLSKDSTHVKEMNELKTKTVKIVSEIEQIRNELFANKSEQENFNRQIIKRPLKIENYDEMVQKLEVDVNEYRNFIIEKTNSPALKAFADVSIKFGRFEMNNNPQVIYNNLQKLIRDIKITETELLDNVFHSLIDHLYFPLAINEPLSK
jgi:hypothetical protein